MSNGVDAPATRQMVLDLTRAPSYDPDDFLVSPTNAEAHGLVLRWPHWPSHAPADWSAWIGQEPPRHDLGYAVRRP